MGSLRFCTFCICNHTKINRLPAGPQQQTAHNKLPKGDNGHSSVCSSFIDCGAGKKSGCTYFIARFHCFRLPLSVIPTCYQTISKYGKVRLKQLFFLSLPTQGTNVNLTPERVGTSLKLGTSSPVYHKGKRHFFILFFSKSAYCILTPAGVASSTAEQRLLGASLHRLLWHPWWGEKKRKKKKKKSNCDK